MNLKMILASQLKSFIIEFFEKIMLISNIDDKFAEKTQNAIEVHKKPLGQNGNVIVSISLRVSENFFW